MKSFTSTLALVAALSGTTASAGAQTTDHLSVEITATTIGIAGGEQPRTFMSTGALAVGKTTSSAFAASDTICGFGAAPTLAAAGRHGAVSAWNVNVTPTAVADDAVTFRVQWVRSRFQNRDTNAPAGNMTLTMKPGESMPLDLVQPSPAVRMPFEKCGILATALRVGVKYWPPRERDGRLSATDLWLVERLADGSERTQLLTVRGQFNQVMPFHFEPLIDGEVSLDFYGTFTATPGDGVVAIKLTTRSRLVEGNTSAAIVTDVLQDGNMMRAREVESIVRLAPGEVVAMELPRLGENGSAAFADRAYSIRVRSLRLR